MNGEVGVDGYPICDEFACRTWGCWCDRAPDPKCEHGGHPRDCNECVALDERLAEVVHACPPGDAACTPCCGRTPFELPMTDRITLDDALVTCQRLNEDTS